MLLLYYIMLLISESSMTFSVSHDHVICDCDICDHPVTNFMLISCFVTCITIMYNIILHPLSKSKIRIRSSLLFTILTLCI